MAARFAHGDLRQMQTFRRCDSQWKYALWHSHIASESRDAAVADCQSWWRIVAADGASASISVSPSESSHRLSARSSSGWVAAEVERIRAGGAGRVASEVEGEGARQRADPSERVRMPEDRASDELKRLAL
jgi:hypothetical protein